MKNKLFIKVLLEKAKKTKIKDVWKYYIPELMIKNKDTLVEYEISELDMTDEDNPIVSIFRYNVDGTVDKTEMYTVEEIESKFDIA